MHFWLPNNHIPISLYKYIKICLSQFVIYFQKYGSILQLYYTSTFGKTQFYVSLCFIPEHTHNTYIFFLLIKHITENKTIKENLLGNWFISCSTGIFPHLAFLQPVQTKSTFLLLLASYSTFWNYSIRWSLLLYFHPLVLLLSVTAIGSNWFEQLIMEIVGEQWDASISLYQY